MDIKQIEVFSDEETIAGSSEDDEKNRTVENLHEKKDSVPQRDLWNTSCDTIRRKINMFLATKEMTQKAFMEAIGHAGSSSFSRFMSYKGRDGGRQNTVFRGALKFFYRREQDGKERKAAEKASRKAEKASLSGKKRKISDVVTNSENMLNGKEGPVTDQMLKKAAKLDSTTSSSTNSTSKKSKAEMQKFIEDIVATPCEGPVYDDCDEIRRKIANFIQNDHVPLARFAAAIGLTPSPVNKFMAKKGAKQGAGTQTYRKAYYFFEKLRLFRNEPKSIHRLISETKYPNGYPLENPDMINPDTIWYATIRED